VKKQKLSKRLISKPGDTIIELLEHYKMSQSELAERMGKTASKINDIINGKEPITIQTALQLEKVLGPEPDAQFWLTRESVYREKLARLEEEEQMVQWISWAEMHPLREIKACGHIVAEKGIEAVKQLLLFYGIASPKQWETVCVPQYATDTKFRKSEAFKNSIASISAWLRMGEIDMKSMTLPGFDKELFRQNIEEVKTLVVRQPKDFAKKLQKKCAEVGVAVVYTRCLPHAPISGATRWIGGNPLIQLSDRYKTNDHFWFSFYHEAGHILLHGKKDVFLEEANEFTPNKEKEEEANALASKYLLPENFVDELPDNISDRDIVNVAAKYNTHPGVVVGRLQHIGRLPFSSGNRFKEKLSLFDA
jgi:HTH-type transcriptional regulator / antitoxin HigA